MTRNYARDKMSSSSIATGVRGRRRPTQRLVTAKGRSQLSRRSVTSDEDINRIKRMYLDFKKAPTGDIASINYNLYSWEDIIARTTTRITTPHPGGTNSLNSIQMGTDIPSGTCATCHLDVRTCPGHLGRIEFKYPIAHPSQILSGSITHVMNSICETCGTLRLEPSRIRRIVEELPADESKRLRAISAASMNAVCRTPGCYRGGNIRREYRDGVATYRRADSSAAIVPLQYILSVFDNISVEDAELLQFRAPAHPRNLIMRGLIVIPPCARAPAIMDDGTIRNSDTTDLYRAVIEANDSLRSPDNIDALARAVNDLMYVGTENVQGQTSGSFKYKINDKANGAIRSVSQGKTIMNSGRAVITGDPTLRFGEIGVPRVLANRMRIKETVTEESIDRLTMYLRDRKIYTIHPISGDFAGYQLRVTNNIRETYQLTIGDIVERPLMEENRDIGQRADIIMTFRQPVLHKYSLMAGTVRFRDSYTFSLHMAETTARNADFDGDEINMHATTDVETMDELYRTLYAPRNIISAQNSMTLLSVVYDGLISIYEMMRNPDRKISKLEFMNFLKVITNRTDLPTLAQRASDLGITELFTYRMVFSAIMPAGLTYRKNDVIIENGILLEGRPGRNNVGNSPDTIIQAILLQYNYMRARDFITDVYFILVEYLSNHAYTVGYKDLIAPRELIEYKNAQVERLMQEVEQLNHNNQNEIERKISEQKIIFKINAITESLNKRCRDELSLIGNRFVPLIDSGAKGKNAELGAMVISVGQRYSQGQRMKLQLNHGTRCLPYFKEGDNSPLARGYCPSSYFEGFTLPEFLMGQTGARDDIVTMMMGTPDTGSLSRQTVRVMENAKTSFDGSVTNPGGKIVQYIYGNDGLEPERMINVNNPISNVNTFSVIDWILDDINSRSTGTRLDNEPGLPAPLETYDADEYQNGPVINLTSYSTKTSPPPIPQPPVIKGQFNQVQLNPDWVSEYVGDSTIGLDMESLIADLLDADATTTDIYEELRSMFVSDIDPSIFNRVRSKNITDRLETNPSQILVYLGSESNDVMNQISETLGLRSQNVYNITVDQANPGIDSVNKFVRKSTYDLIPMDTETVDIVIMTNILDVYTDVAKSITEAHRILKKGGILMLPTNTTSQQLDDIQDGLVNMVFTNNMTPSEFNSRGVSRLEMDAALNGFGMIHAQSDTLFTIWYKPK